MSISKGEIYKQFNDSQDKFAYFSLAVAASAIAYALKQSEGKTLQWSLIPLGLSVISWIISFYLGCIWLRSKSHVLYLNYQLKEVEDGTHPLSGTHREKQQIGIETLSETMKMMSDKAGKLMSRHFILLIWGVISFIIWYVWEMLKASHILVK